MVGEGSMSSDATQAGEDLQAALTGKQQNVLAAIIPHLEDGESLRSASDAVDLSYRTVQKYMRETYTQLGLIEQDGHTYTPQPAAYQVVEDDSKEMLSEEEQAMAAEHLRESFSTDTDIEISEALIETLAAGGSMKDAAEQTGYALPTVSDRRDLLEDAGLIEREGWSSYAVQDGAAAVLDIVEDEYNTRELTDTATTDTAGQEDTGDTMDDVPIDWDTFVTFVEVLGSGRPRSAVEDATGLSYSQVQYRHDQLKDAGLFVQTGTGQGTAHHLTPDARDVLEQYSERHDLDPDAFHYLDSAAEEDRITHAAAAGTALADRLGRVDLFDVDSGAVAALQKANPITTESKAAVLAYVAEQGETDKDVLYDVVLTDVDNRALGSAVAYLEKDGLITVDGDTILATENGAQLYDVVQTGDLEDNTGGGRQERQLQEERQELEDAGLLPDQEDDDEDTLLVENSTPAIEQEQQAARSTSRSTTAGSGAPGRGAELHEKFGDMFEGEEFVEKGEYHNDSGIEGRDFTHQEDFITPETVDQVVSRLTALIGEGVVTPSMYEDSLQRVQEDSRLITGWDIEEKKQTEPLDELSDTAGYEGFT